jgi:hypothetical protein
LNDYEKGQASMRLFKLLLIVVALGAAYRWWHGKGIDAAASAPGPDGFVSVQMPDASSAHAVLILSAPNCPSEQAQHAEALVDELARKGIPVVRSDTMAFDLDNPTPEQIAGVNRAVAVFNQGAPAVFVNGRAKSNPTAAETIAEYRQSKAEH